MTLWGDLPDKNIVGMSISYGKSSAEAIIKTLFMSKGHRSNLLDKRFKEVGVAYCQDKKQRAVLVFANNF